MRVLRLSNSMDFFGDIPAEGRSMAISGRALEAEVGEPVEVISKMVWPNDRLPALIDGWIDEFEPSLVFLWINPFWFTYESGARFFERRLGRFARRFIGLEKQVARRPAINQNPAYKGLRRLAVTTIGGNVFVEPQDLLPMVETWVRRVLRREEITLVVRGALMPMHMGATRPGRSRSIRRYLEMEAAGAALCQRLHVDYIPSPPPGEWIEQPDLFLGDRFHCNAEGHAKMGEIEAEGMVAAWRRSHSPAQP